MNMKPFAHHDWYGFAGAERFADGSEPLIGEIGVEIDGTLWASVVVLDANGISVMTSTDDGDEVLCVYFPGAYAALAVSTLARVDSVTRAVLVALPGAEIGA